MNKKVQNYLSENENTKQASIKEFIANHKSNLKRAVALGLSTATIVSMLAGCDENKTPSSTTAPSYTTTEPITTEPNTTTGTPVTTEPVDEETMFPLEQPERSEEEINATGVQVEDVKATATNISYHFFRNELTDDEKYGKYDLSKASCEFTSLGSNYFPKTNTEEKDYTRAPYLDYVERGYSENNTKCTNCYMLSLTFNYNVGKKVEEFRVVQLPVPAGLVDRLMESYNIESKIVDKQYMQSIDYYKVPRPGTKIYEISTIVDKETIKNATDEQLKAIYDVLDAIDYYLETGTMLEDNQMEQ